MKAIAFDTHAYVKKLKAVGFTEDQAEVLSSTQAELIDERLATKQDIKNLESVLKRDIKELETATKQDLRELELRIKYDLTIRVGAMLAATTAILAALIKL